MGGIASSSLKLHVMKQNFELVDKEKVITRWSYYELKSNDKYLARSRYGGIVVYKLYDRNITPAHVYIINTSNETFPKADGTGGRIHGRLFYYLYKRNMQNGDIAEGFEVTTDGEVKPDSTFLNAADTPFHDNSREMNKGTQNIIKRMVERWKQGEENVKVEFKEAAKLLRNQ